MDIQKQTKSKEAFIDDMDLRLLMEHYYDNMLKRGVQLSPIQKITSQKNKQPKDLPQDLHQQMDKNAKLCRQLNPSSPHVSLPIERPHIQDHDGEITSSKKVILETHWSTYLLENYYLKRWEIPLSEFKQLDWKSYEINYKKASPTLQKYIIKLLTGWLPVLHQVNKMTAAPTYCPHCDNDETIAHIFQCKHREKWKTTFEQNLHEQLIQQHTPFELILEIRQYFHDLLYDHQNYQHFHHFKLFAGLIPR